MCRNNFLKCSNSVKWMGETKKRQFSFSLIVSTFEGRKAADSIYLTTVLRSELKVFHVTYITSHL